MRVVLVGNGFSQRWGWDGNPNRSAHIDAADIVIRMNGCHHYYHGWTGFRTDILAVRSACGFYGRRLVQHYDVTIPKAVAESAKHIVVIGSEHETREASVPPYLVRYGWQNEQCEFWTLKDYWASSVTVPKLATNCTPTLGALAIVWALTTYPNATIELAGFVWEQAHGTQDKKVHDWSAERAWIFGLDADGVLSLLE